MNTSQIENSKTFAFLCNAESNETEVINFYKSHDIDIHHEMDIAFRNCCATGKLEVIKLLLLDTKINDTPIDIHICSELGFRMACFNQHVDTARWLLLYSVEINSPINFRIFEDHIFRTACSLKHDGIANLLYTICPCYTIEYGIYANSICGFDIDDIYERLDLMIKDPSIYPDDRYDNIINTLRMENVESVDDKVECLVCLGETEEYISLPCKHNFCPDCLISWEARKRKNKCCYCNKSFFWFNCFYYYISGYKDNKNDKSDDYFGDIEEEIEEDNIEEDDIINKEKEIEDIIDQFEINRKKYIFENEDEDDKTL